MVGSRSAAKSPIPERALEISLSVAVSESKEEGRLLQLGVSFFSLCSHNFLVIVAQ